jgi:hypothetical protein
LDSQRLETETYNPQLPRLRHQPYLFFRTRGADIKISPGSQFKLLVNTKKKQAPAAGRGFEYIDYPLRAPFGNRRPLTAGAHFPLSQAPARGIASPRPLPAHVWPQ